MKFTLTMYSAKLFRNSKATKTINTCSINQEIFLSSKSSESSFASVINTSTLALIAAVISKTSFVYTVRTSYTNDVAFLDSNNIEDSSM
ncbi:hypothetical protein DICPUDRAFT_154545 [Dictyostelium purpureum]|uniref:Uncharacterized protein n=1 Tax=Dictyostelium purpureum TaxID=5786 RepID=F0ZRL8_DICPU|nr:uncharacterized protein DICPUDRAFT_154545 [Dictyostelium purpureum]EGC33395.1 hypothetical protein DICPUDRAFT_154545 [Dictyostelium purpureum]|eukprot:XP_003290059.1 hypothetical protein DICPUDRAFT_154545 [Dictyostelium purpureum]